MPRAVVSHGSIDNNLIMIPYHQPNPPSHRVHFNQDCYPTPIPEKRLRQLHVPRKQLRTSLPADAAASPHDLPKSSDVGRGAHSGTLSRQHALLQVIDSLLLPETPGPPQATGPIVPPPLHYLLSAAPSRPHKPSGLCLLSSSSCPPAHFRLTMSLPLLCARMGYIMRVPGPMPVLPSLFHRVIVRL